MEKNVEMLINTVKEPAEPYTGLEMLFGTDEEWEEIMKNAAFGC